MTGACWVQSMFNVTIQLSTPRWVVGRALTLYQTCTFGGMAAGSLILGALAERSGAPTALVVAAILLIIGALIGIKLPPRDDQSLKAQNL